VSPYREQLALALRAVAVRAPDSYTWFGRAFQPVPRALTRALEPSDQRKYLIRLLETELYRSFYSRGRPVSYLPGHDPPDRANSAFVETLSGCNRGLGGWEADWRVEAVDGPSLEVARDGVHVNVPASDCQPPGAVQGELVSVRRPNEERFVSPAFYFALGDADPSGHGDAMEVRVYFHLTAAGAAHLVAHATDLLNNASLPFSLKVLNHPVAYTRCDAAVLYLRQGDFAPARGPLRAIVSACAPYLRSDPPAFTKPLSRGVAVAEHLPRHGESFGMSRCRLLAEGIVAAHEHRASSLADRVEFVARCFAHRGLAIDLPYLAPGSADGYEL
jgi:HopA1 effector protein family